MSTTTSPATSDEVLAMAIRAALSTGRSWFASRDAVGPALQMDITDAMLLEWEQRRLLINPRSATLQTTILTTIQPATRMFNYMFGMPTMLTQPVEWTKNQALAWSDWLYTGYHNYWKHKNGGGGMMDDEGAPDSESAEGSLVFVPVLEMMVSNIISTLLSVSAIRRIFTIDEWMEFLVVTCRVITTETVTQDLLYKQILHPIEDSDHKMFFCKIAGDDLEDVTEVAGWKVRREVLHRDVLRWENKLEEAKVGGDGDVAELEGKILQHKLIEVQCDKLLGRLGKSQVSMSDTRQAIDEMMSHFPEFNYRNNNLPPATDTP